MAIDVFIYLRYNKIMKNQCCQEGTKKQKEIESLKGDLDILNDINRLRILCLLKGKKEACVCEIYEALNLAQNLVSYHLGKLKEAGFVGSKKKGVWMIYGLGKKKINNFQSLLNNLLSK